MKSPKTYRRAERLTNFGKARKPWGEKGTNGRPQGANNRF